MKQAPFKNWLPPVWVFGGMAFCNLLLGVLRAYTGEISIHKAAMFWACLWSATPGCVRVFNYVYTHFLGGEFEAGGSFLTMAAGAAQLSFAAWRLAMLGGVG